MVLAGFLVRTYFIILNNKTIFDSGCEQICFKKIICIPVQVYCCSIHVLIKITVPIANCTLFGVCDLYKQGAFVRVGLFRRQTWTDTHNFPQASLTPAHLVNGVWVLAEVVVMCIRWIIPLKKWRWKTLRSYQTRQTHTWLDSVGKSNGWQNEPKLIQLCLLVCLCVTIVSTTIQ